MSTFIAGINSAFTDYRPNQDNVLRFKENLLRTRLDNNMGYELYSCKTGFSLFYILG